MPICGYELTPLAEINWPYSIGVWFFVVGSCVYIRDSLSYPVLDIYYFSGSVLFLFGCMAFMIDAHCKPVAKPGAFMIDAHCKPVAKPGATGGSGLEEVRRQALRTMTWFAAGFETLVAVVGAGRGARDRGHGQRMRTCPCRPTTVLGRRRNNLSAYCSAAGQGRFVRTNCYGLFRRIRVQMDVCDA